jgi:GMP synthase (glutamine-hydrolysing)
MVMSILLINVCKEKLHYLEFVKPVEDILRKENITFFTKHYRDISPKDLVRATKVIICGTSLADNDFIKKNNLLKFKWLLDLKKPVLGICAGMQIMGLIMQETTKLNFKKEIGFYYENFSRSFLSLTDKQEVYHLHNNYVIFDKTWQDFTDSKINQAVKHKSKNFFGVLFHPEVRQKGLITNFCKL